MARPPSHRTSRTRWTPEQAKVVLDELERSGMSPRAFAARRGMDPERLYRWRARLSGSTTRSIAKVTAPGFTEVSVSGAPVAHYRTLGNGFEIVMTSGVLVRVGPSFEPSALRELLAVVTDAGC